MTTLPDLTRKPLARKVRIDTRAVDGVRGFAVFHIVCGHLLLFSDVNELWPSEKEPSPAQPGSSDEDMSVSGTYSGPCPDGWFRSGDMCYAVPTCEKMLQFWREAGEVCGLMVPGGHLMSGTQEQIAAAVQAFYPGIPDRELWFRLFWTGLNELQEKGTWEWAGGPQSREVTWMDGEPNDWGGREERCTAALKNGRLLDLGCEENLQFLCSVEARMERCPTPCPQQTEDWNRHMWPCGQEQPDTDLCEHGEFGLVALMGGGSMGLFYIISGFVMAVGYCQVMLQPCCGRCGGEPNLPKLSACSFWLRRLVRLAPTYFLTNCLGVALKAAFAPEALNEITTVQFVLSGLGLTSWYIVAPVGNGLTWTISTMLFFYLCFPVLGPAMQRVSVPFLRVLAWAMYLLQAVFMIVGYVLNLGGYWIRMFPPARLPIFIMGICAGLSRVHGEQQRADEADACQTPVSRRDVPVEIGSKGWGMEACCPAWALIFIWTGLSLYGTTVTFICSHNLNFRFNLEVVLPMIFYEFILAVTSPTADFSCGACIVRFFRSRPMRFLGDISMCAYMIHMLLAEALGHAVGRELGSMPWWTLLAVVPVTILLGWLLTEFFEKPIERCCRPDKSAAKKSNAVNETPASAQVIGSPEAKVG